MPHHASLPTAARLQHRSPRPTPASHACLQDEGCPRARGLKKSVQADLGLNFFVCGFHREDGDGERNVGGGKDLSHRPSADCSQARLDSTGTIPRCSSGAGSRVPSCGRGVRDGAAGWSGRRLWRLPAALCCTEGHFRHPVWLPVQNELCAVPAHCIPSVRSYPAVTSAVSEHLFRRLTALAPGALFLLAGIVRLLMDGTSVAGHAMNLFVLLLSALFGRRLRHSWRRWVLATQQAGRQGRQRPSSTGSCNGSRGRGADEVVPSRPLCLLPNALRCGWLIFVDAAASCVQFSMWTHHDAGDAAYFPRRRLPLPMARWRGPEQRACPWSFQT